jgi:hypothetical protein
MPIKLTQTFVRMNVNTPWFPDTLPASHAEYIKTKYKDTGKLTSSGVTSEDGKRYDIVFIFRDDEARLEFFEDAYLQSRLAERNEYNLLNFIDQVDYKSEIIP